ncbi:MAG TPA: hypothetical protein VEY12_06835 [Thermoplasmata archaeon]|nr:hypothetical protein [Thermoplasmata archaeon]
MVREAVCVPNDPVRLVRLADGVESLGDPRFRAFWSGEPPSVYVPELLWKLSGRSDGVPVSGVRDDNRSAILPGRRHPILGQEFLAAVKGCGAAVDAYENAALTADRVRSIARDPASAARLALDDGAAVGFITGERWFGNVPYGGQAPDNAAIGFLTSLRATDAQINGFHVCPVIALLRLPDDFARVASRFFWYRRYEGEFWQEVRLMPSNVRLYFHSPVTFGVDTSRALSLFGVASFEDAERFLENLARSSMAALTLYARTLRHDAVRGAYAGLAYHDVWLDKDAVIAPDGTMHFADLEGIEEVPALGAAEVREEIGRQFHRNVYEATYALEALAWDVDRRWRAFRTGAERRRWILEVLERACIADPFLSLEHRGRKLLLRVEPAVDAAQCGLEIDVATEVGV